MPDEVAADHSNIQAPLCDDKPPTYNEVSDLLLTQLGLEMPAANVKLLGKLLITARRNEENRPNKPGLTEQINRLHEAAFEIQEALVSPPILNWLKAANPGFLDKHLDYLTTVEALQQAAEAALLMTPKGKGRGRSATSEEIPPRANCALLVALLFELSGRECPPPRNETAHAIAEALWLASDGPPWTGHVRDPASWRRYFRDITKASPEYRQALRSFVRTRLGTKLQAGQA